MNGDHDGDGYMVARPQDREGTVAHQPSEQHAQLCVHSYDMTGERR